MGHPGRAATVTDPVRVRVLATQLSASVPGGTGRYTVELVRALAATQPAGASLSALTLRRGLPAPGARERHLDVSRLPLPYPLVARLWQRGLPPWPARSGVVHAPTMLVPPASHRYRLVVTVHDVVPWTHPETLTARGVRFHHAMGERVAQEAALVVTPTQAVAREVERLLEPSARVVAVPSGVSAPAATPDALQRRSRLGVTGDYALFVGTAEPRKGLEVLIDAMRDPVVSGLSLVVAGPPGWGDVSVNGLAAQAGIRDRTVITGRVEDADLASLYAGAAVLVMPSRAEGFGFPILEAMAHGIPVVTSDDPALVEVGGGATLVAPVGDASALAAQVARAGLDAEVRQRLVAAGDERVTAFSWTATARAMWQLYARVSDGAEREVGAS